MNTAFRLDAEPELHKRAKRHFSHFKNSIFFSLKNFLCSTPLLLGPKQRKCKEKSCKKRKFALTYFLKSAEAPQGEARFSGADPATDECVRACSENAAYWC